ncbi:polyketide synthase docking domain-containing protein, partial [Mycobacterium asiaticum]|uniref:polyketide synthase docking domain-containing protein n=1 Tax=Mycobacterium asiaticum TaxID=1790 RepID=UPI000AB60DD2
MNSTPEDLVKALRRSLKQNERLKRENRDLLARTTEPVAAVGMGCRYPGHGGPRTDPLPRQNFDDTDDHRNVG